MTLRALSLLCFCTVLIACADIPELDQAVTERALQADYPDIVPLTPLLEGGPVARLEEDDADILLRRASALQARAARLRAATHGSE